MTVLVTVPGQFASLTVLNNFLLSILPQNTAVLLTQVNRVPEPNGANFVMVTPLFQKRMGTNDSTYDDCQFVGSIALTVLTVTSVTFGTVTPGRVLFGPNVTVGTQIVSQLSGVTGGIGTYRVSASQTVASEKMAAGIQDIEQPIEYTVQLDAYGPNSANNAATISTLFRDGYAVDEFAAVSRDIAPISSDDPKQMPLINEENQYQDRWTMYAVMQVNAVVTVSQQFADQIQVARIPADIFYPA